MIPGSPTERQPLKKAHSAGSTPARGTPMTSGAWPSPGARAGQAAPAPVGGQKDPAAERPSPAAGPRLRRQQGAAKSRARYQAQAAGRREDYFWLRDEQHQSPAQAAERVGRSRRQAERYEAKRRGAPLPKAPAWTPEQTAVALRTDLTVHQKVVLTGKTPHAIRQRRYYIRTQEAAHVG